MERLRRFEDRARSRHGLGRCPFGGRWDRGRRTSGDWEERRREREGEREREGRERGGEGEGGREEEIEEVMEEREELTGEVDLGGRTTAGRKKIEEGGNEGKRDD